MGKMINAHNILVGNPEKKIELGRLKRKWKDNIKTDLREVVYEGLDWIHVVPDMDRWRALVNTITNLRVSEKTAIS
jgi:hypothetical protein